MPYEIGLSTPSVPNRGFTLWIWSVIMVILAGLFVLARLLIRFHNRCLGVDDWTILGSLISSVLLSMTECSAVHYGYGKRSADLDQHHQVIALKWFFAAQVMYKLVLGISKVSFLCLYLRIFIQPNIRRICFGGIIFVICWSLAYTLVTIFQCNPVASFWDKTIKNPKCVDLEAQWMSYAIINILSDVAILTLPIYPISKLRLSRAKKVALAVIFGLGLFVCVTSIIRTTTLAESAESTDPTSGPIPATIWSVIEANVGIICACLPVYKQPLQYLLPKLFGNSQQNTGPPSGGKSRRKTPADLSEGNLQDPDGNAWRRFRGDRSSFSNNVSTHRFEMYPVETDKSYNREITQVTHVKVTYQDDQRSDASSRPLGPRESF
ncbi:predicted protein [Aspergillus terreus NIH2624]|uniref:Rhodopsin domain-containing protein n=1 Tax=Aspergillus terreus (strain NIH 2624 / FGSC A1156) TaxID=341663 RepID=Q0CUM9_ASPTN|nr:uncharacterized protein ATEG_02605 [Aspergillus terreus NIH2624]EAU37567.1 predicted protein [Aspergillus terreus NIH2624]